MYAHSLLSIASEDLKAARVLLREGMAVQAVYHIEQASEKLVKTLLFALCCCWRSISVESVASCYQLVAKDKEGRIADPDDLLISIGHDPFKLLKLLLDKALKSYESMSNLKSLILISGYGIDIPDSSINYILHFVRTAKNLTSLACSKLPGTSHICRLGKEISDMEQRCLETKSEEICRKLLERVIEVFRWLPLQMLNSELRKRINIEELINGTRRDIENYVGKVDQTIKKLYDVIPRNVYQLVQHILPSQMCITSVIASILTAFLMFYLISPLYNILRYPMKPERLELCKDKALVEYFNGVAELCSKPLLDPNSIATENSWLTTLANKAVEVLDNAITNLKEVLADNSPTKTHK